MRLDRTCQEGTQDGTQGIRIKQEMLGWNTEHQDGTGGGTGGVKRRQEVSGWDMKSREGTGATKM